jgi:hypothetical protein
VVLLRNKTSRQFIERPQISSSSEVRTASILVFSFYETWWVCVVMLMSLFH